MTAMDTTSRSGNGVLVLPGGKPRSEATSRRWHLANQRMAAALKAKGYAYQFVFSKGAKHCDGRVFDQTLADTLVWIWRGYHD